MAWVKENSCVGCAECIGCGRKFQIIEYCQCDFCEGQIESVGFEIDGKDACSFCAADEFLSTHFAKDQISSKRQEIEDAGYDPDDIEELYDYFMTPENEQYPVFFVNDRYVNDYDPDGDWR